MDFHYEIKREIHSSAQRSVTMGTNGIVTASQHLASLSGYKILAKGGNAIDAAVAMVCTLSVVEPHMVGLAGDCFALIYNGANGKLVGLNGAGRAPAAANIDWYKKNGYPSMPEHGILSVTVPGALRGWSDLIKRYGNLELKDCFEDAIYYGEKGFAVTEVIAGEWKNKEAFLLKNKEAARVYLSNGKSPAPGKVFRNPDLAATYRQIAEKGVETLYGGELGRGIADFMQQNGGLVTLEDLAGHKSEWVKPICRDYRGYTVCELPPNGQGVAALEMLSIMSGYDIASMGHNSPDYLHRLIEAKKIAFADRDYVVTDPDFYDVPVGKLISPEYAEQCRQLIDSNSVADPAPSSFMTGSDTVYVSAVDKEGNAISLISSIYTPFGSGVVVPSTGISLQNRGMGFSLDPDHPNRLEPGKRTMHTIIPGMLVKEGQFVASFGVMGGEMQPQGHTQLIANLIDFKMNPQEAVDAPRVRHMRGKEVHFETGLPQKTVETLIQMGHQPDSEAASVNVCGGAQLIWKTKDGVLLGGSDRRKDGCAIGF
jgi:gamma-glutamyltranspeptidase/glutathione hydrolase